MCVEQVLLELVYERLYILKGKSYQRHTEEGAFIKQKTSLGHFWVKETFESMLVITWTLSHRQTNEFQRKKKQKCPENDDDCHTIVLDLSYMYQVIVFCLIQRERDKEISFMCHDAEWQWWWR